jgi:hypothetical protein
MRKILVSTILSTKNLGPKIYGVMANGIIEQFIPVSGCFRRLDIARTNNKCFGF